MFKNQISADVFFLEFTSRDAIVNRMQKPLIFCSKQAKMQGNISAFCREKMKKICSKVKYRVQQ
jgi:hypothetical protein